MSDQIQPVPSSMNDLEWLQQWDAAISARYAILTRSRDLGYVQHPPTLSVESLDVSTHSERRFVPGPAFVEVRLLPEAWNESLDGTRVTCGPAAGEVCYWKLEVHRDHGALTLRIRRP